MNDLTLYVQIAWTGLAVASYYVLFAMAFALVLKVMNLFNFAQAGIMGIAYYAMFAALNPMKLPVWAALAFGFLCALAASWLFEIFALRTLRARESSGLMFFILTLIVSEFVAYALALGFGTEPVTLFPTIMSPTRIVANVAVSDWDMIAVATTLALTALLAAFLNLTRTGQHLIAVADNGALAELYGIDARRCYLVALAVAALLATAGMYLYGSRGGVIPQTPINLMLFAVIATILGGIGNVFRAGFAAMLLALLQSYSILVIPSRWQNV
jgi:branched-subunit amino acid ABC-type transport system permease component